MPPAPEQPPVTASTAHHYLTWAEWLIHFDVEKSIGVEGIDLLRRMLMLEPSRRITAAEALRHPFFHFEKMRKKMSSTWGEVSCSSSEDEERKPSAPQGKRPAGSPVGRVPMRPMPTLEAPTITVTSEGAEPGQQPPIMPIPQRPYETTTTTTSSSQNDHGTSGPPQEQHHNRLSTAVAEDGQTQLPSQAVIEAKVHLQRRVGSGTPHLNSFLLAQTTHNEEEEGGEEGRSSPSRATAPPKATESRTTATSQQQQQQKYDEEEEDVQETSSPPRRASSPRQPNDGSSPRAKKIAQGTSTPIGQPTQVAPTAGTSPPPPPAAAPHSSEPEERVVEEAEVNEPMCNPHHRSIPQPAPFTGLPTTTSSGAATGSFSGGLYNNNNNNNTNSLPLLANAIMGGGDAAPLTSTSHSQLLSLGRRALPASAGATPHRAAANSSTSHSNSSNSQRGGGSVATIQPSPSRHHDVTPPSRPTEATIPKERARSRPLDDVVSDPEGDAAAGPPRPHSTHSLPSSLDDDPFPFGASSGGGGAAQGGSAMPIVFQGVVFGLHAAGGADPSAATLPPPLGGSLIPQTAGMPQAAGTTSSTTSRRTTLNTTTTTATTTTTTASFDVEAAAHRSPSQGTNGGGAAAGGGVTLSSAQRTQEGPGQHNNNNNHNNNANDVSFHNNLSSFAAPPSPTHSRPSEDSTDGILNVPVPLMGEASTVGVGSDAHRKGQSTSMYNAQPPNNVPPHQQHPPHHHHHHVAGCLPHHPIVGGESAGTTTSSREAATEPHGAYDGAGKPSVVNSEGAMRGRLWES